MLVNNFIVIDNDTHDAQWDVYLKDKKNTGEVFVLSREIQAEEQIGFDYDRAFILREDYNLDGLEKFIDRKIADGYQISIVYMHRRVLDDMNKLIKISHCQIIKGLLDRYTEINIGVHSGGSLKSIKNCLGERVKTKSLLEIKSKFGSRKGWSLEVDEERG